MAAVMPIGWGVSQASHVPRYRLKRTKAPTEPALDLDEVVLHLRLDPAAVSGPEKPLLEGMVRGATQALEEYAGVAVMSQELTMTLGHWPMPFEALELPMPPFDELVTITVDAAGLDVDDFDVELDERLPAKLFPKSGAWPSPPYARHAGIAITYMAGVENRDDLSPTLRQALLMAVAFFYEQRESTAQFALHPVLELGWRSLLDPSRMPGFA